MLDGGRKPCSLYKPRLSKYTNKGSKDTMVTGYIILAACDSLFKAWKVVVDERYFAKTVFWLR